MVKPRGGSKGGSKSGAPKGGGSKAGKASGSARRSGVTAKTSLGRSADVRGASSRSGAGRSAKGQPASGAKRGSAAAPSKAAAFKSAQSGSKVGASRVSGRTGSAGEARPSRARSTDARRSSGGGQRPVEAVGRPAPRSPQVQGLGGDVVEGIQAVDALLSGDRPVRELAVEALRAEDPDVEMLIAKALERGVHVRMVAKNAFAALAQSQTPQGVQARAKPIQPADIDELCENPYAFLVALDGVTDPGNLGAVMRSACAAGATGLVLPKKRTARLSASAMKSAAGAAERLPVALVAGIPTFLEDAKRRGLWSYGLDGDGDVPYDQARFEREPIVIVSGSEGDGLSPLTKRRCDALVSIPMTNGIESLNVSVATAIVCVEVARQRSALSR